MTSLEAQIKSEFVEKRITFLGAGPMSQTSVDCVIELANYYKKPIALIPSRRQIESGNLGGGYVNNWSTEEFTRYVRKKDIGGFVILSRDHSGPWQYSPKDNQGNLLTHEFALNESKESLKEDLRSGFDLIHLDPSLGLKYGLSAQEIEDDILDLLEYCKKNQTKPVSFEIGADEQSIKPELVVDAQLKLLSLLTRIKREKLPLPLFYVLQTGTKVMETRNIGSFDSKLPVEGMLPASIQLPEMLKMCASNSILIKEHNADYLSDNALKWHRRFGIHAANVAPEFGVAETKALLKIADMKNHSFSEEFRRIVLDGKRWEKWLFPNSKSDDNKKVEIAGHYHFANQEVVLLREKLKRDLESSHIDLDQTVKDEVKRSINRYLRNFGYER